MPEATAPGRSTFGTGIALVLIANLFFALVDISTKWLLATGLLVIQLAFMRYAVHFAITFCQRLWQGKATFGLPGRVRGWVFLRSFALVSATVVNFVALGQLPLAVTGALLFLSPLFICLFARSLLGEQISPGDWAAIAIGLAGAFMIFWPFGAPINWYAVLMLYPAAGIALYQVLTRKLATEVRPGVLQFVTGALGTAVLAPMVLLQWHWPETSFAWSLLIALGALAWAGHEALTRAFAHAEASALAPFGYSFVVYLTVASVLLFEDSLAPNVLLGAALIVLAGILSWRFHQKT